MRATRAAPHLQAGKLTEHEEGLADGASGSDDEHSLALLHSCCSMQRLICGRPAQDQRGRLSRVDGGRHADQVAGPERAICGIRPEDGHIAHAVAKLKAANAIADLIDFTYDVIAEHERRRRRIVCG